MFRVLKRRLLITVSATVLLASCSATQLATVQNDSTVISSAISAACTDVTAASNLAAPFVAVPAIAVVLSYATASCSGATAIAALVTKAVNDPTTVAWAENLAVELKALVAQIKAAQNERAAGMG